MSDTPSDAPSSDGSSSDPPCFVSALSTDSESAVAEQRCLATLTRELDGRTPDLLLFFATHDHLPALRGLSARLRQATGARIVAGCTGASIVGGAREVESKPALSLWAGHLPGTATRAVHLLARQELDESIGFAPEIPVEDPARAGVLLLAEPYTFPAQAFLPVAARELPGTPIVGGLASGGSGPGENLLWLDDRVHDEGAIAIVIEGDVELVAAVSQGCRPVGPPLVITACDGHLIQSLRGRRAAKAMFAVLSDLPTRDRELFRRGPHIGLAIDPTRQTFEAGDLLVRSVVGIHPQNEALAVGDDSLRVGQTVQFMVRDAASASDELTRILASRAPDWRPAEPSRAGALLFTCGGRGAHLFRTLNHDAGAIQEHVGPDLPLAGFFANGEIGPVGGRSFLHGFTASVALLRPREGPTGGPSGW